MRISELQVVGGFTWLGGWRGSVSARVVIGERGCVGLGLAEPKQEARRVGLCCLCTGTTTYAAPPHSPQDKHQKTPTLV